MNLSEQQEPSKSPPSCLAEATIEDLVRELKARCHAMVLCMTVDDDEDNEEVTFYRDMGGRINCIGMLEDAKYTLLQRGME